MNLNVNAYRKQLKKLPKVAVKQGKFAADLSADKLLDGKKIMRKAEKATLTLNNIAYGTVKKLIGQQFKVAEELVDASAKRLKTTAKANNAKALLKAQSKLNQATRKRVITDVKETVAILGDTKDDLVKLFNNVYNIKPAAKKIQTVKTKKATVAKAVKKTAKKSKPTAKRATRKASKKVAKKVTKRTSSTRAKAKKASKRKTTRRRRAA